MASGKQNKNITHRDVDLERAVWNLEDFYYDAKDPRIAEDFQDLAAQAKSFASKYQTISINVSANILFNSVKDFESIEELGAKIISYAFLRRAVAINDSEVNRFYQDTIEKVTAITSGLVFYPIEINKIDNSLLDVMLLSDQRLAKYSNWFRLLRKAKKHQLSAELEKFDAEKSVVCFYAWNRLFDEAISALRFEYRGNSLGINDIFLHMQSSDEREREEAGQIIADVLKKNINTFAIVTNVLAKNKAIDDDFRSFARPIQHRNLLNDVEDEVVDLLLATVKKNYSRLSHRYYKLKAKILKKERLNYWDRNAPYVRHEEYIPWGRAKELVLRAYRNFSPKFSEIGELFFNNNWIDAPAKDSKMFGAFSHSTVPSAHPLILLNYQGKERDVATLAHELGHGIHQVLSAEQGILMSNASLSLAETASVFGEQLVFRALLEESQDKHKNALMIANKIEDMLNTTVRQIAFCEFELLVHGNRRKKELSVEEICDFWMRTQREALGDGVFLVEDYKYYWSYIAHFVHSDFYVYSYAFGDCLVNALYEKYRTGHNGFVDKYLKLLRSGNSVYYADLLAEFGLNPKEEAFWQSGLNVIGSFIDELEKNAGLLTIR